MKLSILHPSRSRPQQAFDTCYHWLSLASGIVTWEYIVSIDSDDETIEEYRRNLDTAGTNIIVKDNQNLVQAANQAAKVSTGDILILVSDDFKCFKNWDLSIVDALHGKSGVLKTFDGIQRWIVTLPVMTRDYYEQQGYLYDPLCTHMLCDTIMTHKADIEKKLIIRNDIVFRHNHYSIGGQQKDAVNVKADSTWAQGEKTYLQRLKEWKSARFNIYDLSPEATMAGHVNWMKKKGIK